MPQLIALGLIGGLVWYAYRAFKRQMAAVAEELRKSEEDNNPKTVDALEKGDDGVYRPKRKSPDKS
jgi:hypothetical protein